MKHKSQIGNDVAGARAEGRGFGRANGPWPGLSFRGLEGRGGLWKKIKERGGNFGGDFGVEIIYTTIYGGRQARSHLAFQPPLAWRKAVGMASMANLRECVTLLAQSEGALAEPTAHGRSPGRGFRGLEGLGPGRSERSGRMTSPGKETSL